MVKYTGGEEEANADSSDVQSFVCVGDSHGVEQPYRWRRLCREQATSRVRVSPNGGGHQQARKLSPTSICSPLPPALLICGLTIRFPPPRLTLAGVSFAGVASPRPLPQTPYAHARIVHSTISKFCCSKDTVISYEHIYIPEPKETSGNARSQKIQPPPSMEWVLKTALEIWALMGRSRKPQNALDSAGGGGGRGEGAFRISNTFDSIQKVFQLSRPNLSDEYDLILLDEAQDVNDCQADIIARQSGCRVIVVGDPNQVACPHLHDPSSVRTCMFLQKSGEALTGRHGIPRPQNVNRCLLRRSSSMVLIGE